VKAHVPRWCEVQIIGCHRERLCDARARVVQKDQERVVAQAGGAAAIGLGEHHPCLLGLEVLDRVHGRALRVHGQDALVLLCARQVVAEQVLDEAANGRESAIARGGSIAALRLDMVEEGDHLIDDDVIESKVAHAPASLLREEQEEEPQRVAIGANCVRTGPSNSS
jgi:hypothetical protein